MSAFRVNAADVIRPRVVDALAEMRLMHKGNLDQFVLEKDLDDASAIFVGRPGIRGRRHELRRRRDRGISDVQAGASFTTYWIVSRDLTSIERDVYDLQSLAVA